MSVEAIKKALEGVTPGPWGYVASNENHGPYVCNDWGAGDICDGYVMSNPDSLSVRNGGNSRPINHQHDEADANMRYIAAVNPAAVSELLSTLESLQRENEELRKDKDHIAAEKAGIAKNAHSNVDCWKSQAEAAEAEVKRLRDLLRFSHDTLWEINTSNYDHDDVCKLNDASVEVILAIAPELGETHGKSKEWWDERQALASTGGEHHAE